MAAPTKQTFLSELKKYGVPYVDMTAGSEGGVGNLDCEAITIHDSVTLAMNDLEAVKFCKRGRKDLRGPLYNVILGQNGVAYLLTMEMTNNTGPCNGERSLLARRGQVPLDRQLGRPGADTASGNPKHAGIAYRTYSAGPYSPLQIDRMPLVLAAWGKACDWSARGTAQSVIEHGEVTKRKSDPALDGSETRRRIISVWDLNKPVAPEPMLKGEIEQKYLSDSTWTAILGNTVTLELPTPDGRGRYNHFERGSIYWSPETGAWPVYGNIRVAYSELHWEAGHLGYPVSDEYSPVEGVRKQDFQHGSLVCSMSTGSVNVEAKVL